MNTLLNKSYLKVILKVSEFYKGIKKYLSL